MNVSALSHSIKSRMPPALRYPAYRSYWMGMLASVTGFQVTYFAQIWLVHKLTDSPLYLGYLGVASAIPAILLNLFGGVFADRVDKQRLIVVTKIIGAGLIGLLATLTLLDVVRIEHVLIIAFLAGAVEAFDQPARQSLYPHLIERKVIMNAVALNASIWQGTRVIAPALGGLIIAVFDTATAFYLGTAGYLAMAFVVWRLDVPSIPRRARSGTAHDMLEGLKFIKNTSPFAFLISMTFFNSFFGMSYVMLMPIFAEDILNVGVEGQGTLLSIGGIGAVATTLWMSWRSSISHKRAMLIGGATATGICVAAFGITSEYIGSYGLAMAIMFITGVFNSMYLISIMSSLQLMVSDEMRGRVMGIHGMTWSIMPLGGMQAGALATIIEAPFAVAVGGIAVTAFAMGPAMLSSRIRNLEKTLRQHEPAPASH